MTQKNARTRATLTAALMTAALSIAGCAGPPGPSDEFLDGDVSARVLSAVQALDYPFEGDPAYAVRVGNLQTHLIDECVAAQGIPVPTTTDLPLESAAVAVSQSRLWLLPGDDYGVSTALYDPVVLAQLRAGEEPQGSSQLSADETTAYDQAVYGAEAERIDLPIEDGGLVSVPVGGCFGEATEAMYGVDAETYERTYAEIPSMRTVMRELTADDDVQKTMSGWSSCMRDEGYRAEQPDDLYGVMNDWIVGVIDGMTLVGSVAEAERSMAAADLGCRTESGFGTAVSTRFLAIAEAEIAAKEGVVQEYRAMIEHAQASLGDR